MTKPRAPKTPAAQVDVADSLSNVIANLGTARDKASANVYTFCPKLDDQLIAAYRGSWLPRAIVDIPAEDATRKWREWKAEGDQITEIEKLEKRLGVVRKVEQALKMARLLGGSAIYIQTGERNPTRPLDPARVTELRGLTVLTKLDITPEAIIRDIESPYYGRPEYYTIRTNDQTSEVRIHASRLVVFEGHNIPTALGIAGYRDGPLTGIGSEGWADSVLQSVIDIVSQHDSTVANITSLVFEAKINVFKFKGFSQQLMDKKGGSVTNRLMLQAAHKGINGDVVIDAEDDFEQRNASFGGLDSLLERFGYLVAGAAEIPATRLFGRSAAGLSGSGDGDERVYFDRINHEQNNRISPAMELLDECIIRVALGDRPPEVWYEWRPLRQVSEQERATIFKTVADGARAIAGTVAGELVPLNALSDSLVNELTELGVLPGLEAKVEEYGSLGEQLEEAGEDRDVNVSVANDAAPRTLYVRRNVLNASDIVEWAKAQGFATTLPADDMHVTIAYSKVPVDWFKVGTSWQEKIEIAAGGPRQMESFGDARVLLISSNDLTWRHNEIREAGASWDHPEYQPHITISYGNMPESVEAYQGPIVLGPEIFEELNKDWQSEIVEE